MDLTAGTRDLAAASNTAARLFSPRYTDPVLAGMLLRVDGAGIRLSGNDRERSVSVPCPATVHTDGAVLVPANVLAETIRALDAPAVRLTAEGARLAIRVPGARFALPLLDIELHPGADARTPPVVATMPGEALAVALRTVVGTTAKDDTLPMFTGVRLWSGGEETVRLLGSDRYRMAEVSVPAEIERPFDVLVPAALLGEIARRPVRTAALRATENRFGVDLDDVRIGSAVLDGGFLTADAIHTSTVDTTVELAAAELSGAARRIAGFAERPGVLSLDVSDGAVRLSASSERFGEAEETVKAEVSGGRTSPSFQARYLLDALAPFDGRRIRLDLQPGLRATVIRAIDVRLDAPAITYYVMPMNPPR